MRVVAIGAHPDDVELTCGGLVAKLGSMGHDVRLSDLTSGELGSSGNEKTRALESAKAASILGVSSRECCGLPDGGLDHSNVQQVKTVVELIRRHRPSLVLGPYRHSRHPDHVEASEMIRRGVFLAGLRRFDASGRPHGLVSILYYMGDVHFVPSFIVDVGKFFKKKMKAVRVYRSQFERNRPDSYPTRLNRAGFMDLIEARAKYLGGLIGAEYGEGFLYEGSLRVDDPTLLVGGR
ncbi:MAG: bacillithiol biosynthesis deacetylase BshB1 [Candidatus Eiseniibacteriota bacterium]|nr:MAG: bacillithiol biosynthesis deacetylase BshB1 [Candidatus Eisenbacteria bacterium]